MGGSTSVLIVGGGPTGLVLANELGRWGVRCVLIDDKTSTSVHPQANANSARTMEHYRRLGFADEVRSMGIPASYPTDVAYFTRISGHELARFPQPSPEQTRQLAFSGEYLRTWFTPELPHRGSQLFLEPILLRHAAAYPSVDIRFGWRLDHLSEGPEGVVARIADVASGREDVLQCNYLVGCDGPRSTVRDILGIRYAGEGGVERDFMGGQMFSIYFRAPTFFDRIPHGRAWQYWSLLPDQRAVMVTIDGRETFAGSVQVGRGTEGSPEAALRQFQRAFGVEIPAQVISSSTWTAGHALVATHLSRGRVVLAGDAAHLFTPTGGMGYNTGVDDAANLGWKLAAILGGWGGSALLARYELERRPIAARNTAFASRIADSIGRRTISADIDDAGPDAAHSRAELGGALKAHAALEFDIPGLQLGLRYDSPLITGDRSPDGPDNPNVYVPSGRPGNRAPHVWLAQGDSIYDRLAIGFTLLRLGTKPPEGKGFATAARALGIPLGVVEVRRDDVRVLYGADLVLVRPDQHISWRGSQTPETVTAVLTASVGR